MTTVNRLQKMKEFYNSLVENLDLEYYADESHQSFEDLERAVDDGGGFNVEIIYYSRAMQYLMENDNSLRNSLEIASDMGYECKNLSSEILASLLASQQVRNDFEDIRSEIETFFEELNNEEEETEDSE